MIDLLIDAAIFVTLASIIAGLLLMVIVTRRRFLEYMDIKFQGVYTDYGIVFNSQRAGVYGLVLSNPKLLAANTYKNVDFESIPKGKKTLYIVYFWNLILVVIMILLLAYMNVNNIGV